jgi:hypothetical protein
VIGGVVAGTVLAVMFVPVFFVLVLRIFGARRPGEAAHRRAAVPAQAGD